MSHECITYLENCVWIYASCSFNEDSPTTHRQNTSHFWFVLDITEWGDPHGHMLGVLPIPGIFAPGSDAVAKHCFPSYISIMLPVFHTVLQTSHTFCFRSGNEWVDAKSFSWKQRLQQASKSLGIVELFARRTTRNIMHGYQFCQ